MYISDASREETEWDRAVGEVADLVRIPATRRQEFYEELERHCWMAEEYEDDDRHRKLLLVEGPVKDFRRKLNAAYDAARALTPAQRERIGRLSCGSMGLLPDWFERLDHLSTVLNGRIQRERRPPGRPAGSVRARWTARWLVKVVEDCGGRLPSSDHDPNRATINKVIKILQPYFPPKALPLISPKTLRRAQEERRRHPGSR